MRLTWLLVTGMLAAVMFTKYSFGLFFVPGLVAALVTAAPPWRAGRRAWSEALAVSGLVLVLFASWWLVTDRTTLLLGFVDHDTNAPILSLDNLLYLPTVWLGQYATTPALALTVIGLAAIGGVRRWSELAVRLAFWSTLAALVVLTLSAVHEPRHFLPLAPPVWMLAGLGLVEVLHWLEASTRRPLLITGMLVVVFGVLAVGAMRALPGLRGALAAAFEGSPTSGAVQEFALHTVDPSRPVLFMGDFDDQFGLLAMRWRAATLVGRDLWILTWIISPTKCTSVRSTVPTETPGCDIGSGFPAHRLWACAAAALLRLRRGDQPAQQLHGSTCQQSGRSVMRLSHKRNVDR